VRRLPARPLRWLLALTLAAGVLTSLRALEARDRIAASTEALYFPSGRFLSEAALGYREVAADLLWFRTTQYYGAFRRGEHDLRYFRELIDGVTRLDPRFTEAFYFGSLVYGMENDDVPSAVDILKRGVMHNPDRWLLPFNIGFTYYMLARDHVRAGHWFRAAADTPGATDFARRFAAYVTRRAGDVEASLALWMNLRDTTSNPKMREIAQRNVERCREILQQGRPQPPAEGP
jgi:hypothetical protein